MFTPVHSLLAVTLDFPTTLGPLELAALAVVVGLFLLPVLFSLFSGRIIVVEIDVLPFLLLEEFHLAPSLDNEVQFRLTGRPRGLLALLLRLIGLGTKVHLEVTRSQVRREMKNPFWTWYDSVPVSSVASIHLRSRRNPWLLVLGLVFGIVAATIPALPAVVEEAKRWPSSFLIPGAVVAGSLALVCVLAYFLSMTFAFLIRTGGGNTVGLRFKPTLVGEGKVDLRRMQDAVEALNALVLQTQSISSGRGYR